MEFKLSSESVSDWLRYIKVTGEPLNWLARYEDNLLAVLRQGISTERQFRKSYELLTLVFPYFALSLSHTKQWSELLRDALLMAQDIKDNDLQVKVFRWMGEAYLKAGQHESARTAFSTALERAETGQINDMKVAVYTGLFKLQWFNFKQSLTRTLVQQALEAAHISADRGLQADLYIALAPAYAQMMETEMALGYGQTAFAYWMANTHYSGIGRSAYTLAAIYMHIGHIEDNKRFLDHAINYLDIARDALTHTDDKWQYPLLAYEQASIYFQLEDFEAAASWYQQSLSEAERMNSPQYVVIAQHGLGLAQTRLANYTSARHHLYLALKHWDGFKNSYEKANVLAALADLELRTSDYALARYYLDQGLQCVDEIQDQKRQEFMQEQFQEIADRLIP